MIRSKIRSIRPAKPLDKLKDSKTGLEWGLAALNNPEFDLRAKALILASVLKYEAARDFGPVAATTASAAGKKEIKADAAEKAASGAYKPPVSPPPPVSRLSS